MGPVFGPRALDVRIPLDYLLLMICLCDISALELYRCSGRLAPDVADSARVAKLSDCDVPHIGAVDDELCRLGVKTRPVHVLVGSSSRSHHKSGMVRHVRATPLPARSLVRVDKGIKAVGPELLFCNLAARDDLDEVDLALIGFELCAHYVLDPNPASWEGYTQIERPLTNARRIRRTIERMGGSHGAPKARAAVAHVRDGSNSPMETIMDALFVLPRRLGGLGLGRGAELNAKVDTPVGPKYVDLLLGGVGLEYKGVRAHSVDKTKRDDRRQNKLVGSGVMVLNVWYEDLVSDHLYHQLVDDVFRAMGRRLRVRDKGYAQRSKLLRARLLPALRRYAGLDEEGLGNGDDSEARLPRDDAWPDE